MQNKVRLSQNNRNIKVLHITPHLGGGVGKALYGLLLNSLKLKLPVEHKILCLEKPVKNIFEKNKKIKKNILIYKSLDHLNHEIKKTDIVQLEFWNHPLIPWLLIKKLKNMRLVMWCHILGNQFPKIPIGIIKKVDKFYCTSKYTIKLSQFTKSERKKMKFISSAGGLGNLKKINYFKKIKIFYAGTLNYSKFNKNFHLYIKSLSKKNLSIDFYGDKINEKNIKNTFINNKVNAKLNFYGFEKNIHKKLSKHNVLLYFLNPNHYGTGENMLVECMAMGIVPFVINNPTERNIVKHLHNGIIIKSIKEFKYYFNKLENNIELLKKLSANARKDAINNYNYKNTALDFFSDYKKIMKNKKKNRIFDNIFGNSAFEWFLSFTDLNKSKYKINKKEINEFIKKFSDNINDSTKGSPMHFFKYHKDFKLKIFN